MKLKNLLIIWLFSLLFIPSFSSAEVLQYFSPFTISNKAWSVYYSQDVVINADLSFETTSNNITIDNVLYLRSDGSTNWSRPFVLVFGRKNWKLYSFYNAYTSSSNYIRWQGFIDNFWLCSSVWCNLTDSFDSIKSFINNNSIVWLALENGATNWSNQWLVWNTSYPSSLCFISTNSETPYLCFTRGSVSSWGSTLIDSLDFSVSNWKDISSWDWFFDNTPFGANYWRLWDWFTIDSVYNSYAENWYTKSLCFSDFSIDNIYFSWDISEFFETDLEDSEYFTWASLFDLRDVYFSGDVNYFVSQLNWYFNMYKYNNIISWYYRNKSKWLYYIAYKWNVAFPNFDSSFYSDLVNYCSFAVVKSSLDWGSIFDNSLINWWDLPEGVKSKLESDFPVFVCAEGSAFCDWVFEVWWWWWWWGSRIATYSDLYNSFFSSLSSNKSLGYSWEGILPYYIVLGFIAFVLLYWLRR